MPVVAHGGESAGADRVELVLDRTPLYAESGGQIADIGTITGTGSSATAKAAVTDVQKIAKTLFVHRVTVESGEFVEGDTVVGAVDPKWRHGATQGHSGTHMVHAALRQVLGPNAVQAGSLNRPGYLRFDFNWQGVALRRAACPDRRGHQRGRRGRLRGEHRSTPNSTRPRRWARWRCSARTTPTRCASSRSADRSRSSCAAAPTSHNSAQIGPVTLLGESSVGSGVRRVEAYVGLDSFKYLAKERALMAGLASSLKVPVRRGARPRREPRRATAGRREGTRRDAVGQRRGRRQRTLPRVPSWWVRSVSWRSGWPVETSRRQTSVASSGDIRGKLGADPPVVALIAEGEGDSVPFVVAVNPAAQDLGLSANDLVKALGATGERPRRRQGRTGAGLRQRRRGIDAALAAVRAEVGRS